LVAFDAALAPSKSISISFAALNPGIVFFPFKLYVLFAFSSRTTQFLWC
jgi:hypothetical protein